MAMCVKHPNGGFIYHNIEIPRKAATYSAWYDANGTLIDAEGFNRRRRGVGVKRGASVWAYLAALGKYHASKSKVIILPQAI